MEEEEKTQSLTMSYRENMIRLNAKCEFLENRMKNFQNKIVPSLKEKCRSLALEMKRRNYDEKCDSGTQEDFFKMASLIASQALKEERIRTDELSKSNQNLRNELSNANKIQKDEIKELKLENENLKTCLAKEKTEKEQKGRNGYKAPIFFRTTFYKLSRSKLYLLAHLHFSLL